MDNKFLLIFAMVFVAIVAVGSVSAEENVTDLGEISTDDIVIDEVQTDDTEIQETTTEDEIQTTTTSGSYNVYLNMSSSDIDTVINTASQNGGGDVTFEAGSYSNVNITLKSNVNLIGYNVSLTGNGLHNVITVTDATNYGIYGFDINANGNVSIYGSGSSNGVISGNTLHDGKDGVSLFRFYDNVTIENNTIYNMSRDGISLANPQGTSRWDSLVGAIINNNNITDSYYGIFIGGAFKGTISNNNITGGTYGMEFAGKPTATQGKLNVTISHTKINGATTGINMDHPNVLYFKLDDVNITVPDAESCYFLEAGEYFANVGANNIYVYNSNFTGYISNSFYTRITAHDSSPGLNNTDA